MSPLSTLRNLVRMAENGDADGTTVADFLGEHAAEFAADLGTTVTDLAACAGKPDGVVAKLIAKRLRARATIARDTKGEASAMLASTAAGHLGRGVQWDEYRGAGLNVGLLFGDVLADRSLAFVGFTYHNGAADEVYAVSRALLVRIGAAIGSRGDVTVYLSSLTPNLAELSIRYRGGKGGYNLTAKLLSPSDAQRGVQAVALAPRPALTGSLVRKHIPVVAAYAAAPVVILEAPVEAPAPAVKAAARRRRVPGTAGRRTCYGAPGCTTPVHAKKLCPVHYRLARKVAA